MSHDLQRVADLAIATDEARLTTPNEHAEALIQLASAFGRSGQAALAYKVAVQSRALVRAAV